MGSAVTAVAALSFQTLLFFGFVSEFVAYGYNTPVDEADVFDVGNFDESLLAKNSAARLHEYWSREVARSSESDDADPPSLITALFHLLSRDLCLSAFYNTSQCLLELSRPNMSLLLINLR